MFSKNTEKLESFIGPNSQFKGNVTAKGTVRIDGKIEGNIEADWLILGESSYLKGDIVARGVVVGGKIDGNIKASEIIEMKPKGQVMGEITTKKLAVAEGAVFNGHAAMLKKDTGESTLKPGSATKTVI